MVDLVGLQEIAERLGVVHQTAKQWRLRGLLPAPDWTISGVPIWSWPNVRDWAERTDRLAKEQT